MTGWISEFSERSEFSEPPESRHLSLDVSPDPCAERTHHWAQRVLAAARPAGDLVRYGTEEWHDLAPNDPRRLAALVLAAECWREHCDPVNIALELLDELREGRREQRRTSWDVCGAADWAAVASRPTVAELQRRRGVA